MTGVEGDVVKWGYQGQRTVDIVARITLEDVRWFDRIARDISDEHLRAVLRASGATVEEVEQFTAALRGRLDQIRDVAGATVPSYSSASTSRDGT